MSMFDIEIRRRAWELFEQYHYMEQRKQETIPYEIRGRLMYLFGELKKEDKYWEKKLEFTHIKRKEKERKAREEINKILNKAHEIVSIEED